MRTHNCEPTLNDEQVIQFCANGFLTLEGVVSDEINRKTMDFVDEYPDGQPTHILNEDWFVDNVILHPEAAGAVRSLLGKDFALPNLMANHRAECPGPAQEWHVDGRLQRGPELNYVQVFYYPQDCPRDMGPTEMLPGSHFLISVQSGMGHYGNIRGGFPATLPAGSIFLTHYSIWHRRSASTGSGIRNNLKYNYWRTVPPKRDWAVEPSFDVATADFSIGTYLDLERPTFRAQFNDSADAAGMYAWLCGKYDEVRLMGGQGWPLPPHNWLDKPYGVPSALLE